jgi:branched-chain amino acid transport system permease protein
VNYWFALILSPLAIGFIGVIVERLFLRHLYKLDPLYGLLLTFGLALVVEGLLHQLIGASGQTYPVPHALTGAFNLGFMILPIYRAWVIAVSLVVCFSAWFVIERTRLGATLRAATENAPLLQAFGVNVPLLFVVTYGGGVALAALAGVLSAPIILVNSQMGSSLVIVVFAVVVIGGMGSILGAIVSGLMLGLVEGFTKVIYPEASNIVVFVIMALVLIVRPAGLFGKE